MSKYIHPFPARMAPDIALANLTDASPSARVLDPMMGSGTVLRAAAELGLQSIGCDIDPLAVLMSRVATSGVNPYHLFDVANSMVTAAKSIRLREVHLAWMDDCSETQQYVEYWFALSQRQDLRRLAWLLVGSEQMGLSKGVANALRLALSRIIVTKTRGASLAWDVSHSRPHKVDDENDFDVLTEFQRSCRDLAHWLLNSDVQTRPLIYREDARRLRHVADRSIDVILTSPPYLNAIDYFRGHRLALVWLGFSVETIRRMRAEAVGTEVGLSISSNHRSIQRCVEAMGDVPSLPPRLRRVCARYAADLIAVFQSCGRVLKRRGQCHFVVGDSNLRKVRLSNADAVVAAAESRGFELSVRRLRRIPNSARYLPAGRSQKSDLGKRMLTEHVLTFSKRTRQR